MTPPSLKRPTIRDVARASGVSLTTVSDALGDRGRISEETRARVKAAALLLGYHASPAARSLVQGRTGLVAFTFGVAPEQIEEVWNVEYFLRTMTGATSSALEHGTAIVLVPATGMASGSVSFDAIIIADPTPSTPLLHQAVTNRLPIVTIGRVAGTPTDVVDNDFLSATRELMQHLSDMGARAPGLIVDARNASYIRDVTAAYEEVCAELEMRPVVVTAQPSMSEQAGREACAQLFAEAPQVDAVITTLDRLALGALDHLRMAGRNVPGEVRIATFGDSAALLHSATPITAVDLFPDELGRQAADQVRRRLAGTSPKQNVSLLVGHKLRVRASSSSLSPSSVSDSTTADYAHERLNELQR